MKLIQIKWQLRSPSLSTYAMEKGQQNTKCPVLKCSAQSSSQHLWSDSTAHAQKSFDGAQRRGGEMTHAPVKIFDPIALLK